MNTETVAQCGAIIACLVWLYYLSTHLARFLWDRYLMSKVAVPVVTASPHAHAIVECQTCGQFVDLHNAFDVAHHRVIGHSPEVIH